MVQRAFILPPQGQIGPLTVGERDQILKKSLIFGIYEKLVDRESAFEILSQKDSLLEEERQKAAAEKERIQQQKEADRQAREAAKTRKEDRGFFGEVIDQVGKSATRQITNQIGRTITRSILGAFFGKR